MDTVCNALGIDRVDLCRKMILIEEQHGSDANFVVNSVISQSLEKGYGICLVLFHNTFGHYHNVGMKLGYNLNVLRERGQVTVVEPMKIVANNVQDLGHDSIDAANDPLASPHLDAQPDLEEEDSSENIGFPDIMKLDTNLVRQLFVPVRNEYLKAMKSTVSTVVIIDDLSHLFDMGLSLRDVWFYIKCLRSLMQYEPLSLCIMTHTYKADPETCQPDMIATGLKHMAQLVVSVEPLCSGRTNDVSGRMSVSWKLSSIRRKYHWPEKTTYLYKLMDRQVKIITPGATSALS